MKSERASLIAKGLGPGLSKTYVGDGRFFSSLRSHQEAWIEFGVEGAKSPLDPCLDLRSHSPTGFAWGYNGSGPAQLALAILADASDPETALQRYQEFKQEFIAKLPQNRGFRIPLDVVLGFLHSKREQTTSEEE
jgi:hypothetical protein